MARLRSCFIIFCPRLLPSPIRKQLRCGLVIHMQVRMTLERAWSIGVVGEGLTTQKSLGLDRGWGKGAGQLVGLSSLTPHSRLKQYLAPSSGVGLCCPAHLEPTAGVSRDCLLSGSPSATNCIPKDKYLCLSFFIC